MTKDEKRNDEKEKFNKRELDFHNNAKKKDTLRVNVMKASVQAQQESLLKSLNKSCCNVASISGPNSLVKHASMFAPSRKHNLSSQTHLRRQTHEYRGAETLRYVLPIDKFSEFKVLVPKSNLQIVTDEGEKLILNENIEQAILNENILKKHQTNLEAIKFLKTQQADFCLQKWCKATDFFVYYEKDRKFEVDKITGEFSCKPRMEKSNIGRMSFRTMHRREKIPQLGRNIRVDKMCCYSAKVHIKTSMQTYPSISSVTKRKSSSTKMIVRQLKPGVYQSRTRAGFLIHTTKFGSFIERLPPGFEFSTKSKSKRNYKLREEESMEELRKLLPLQYSLDQSRSGVLKNSLAYIQDLEREIKERLKIIAPRERLKLTEEHSIPLPSAVLASFASSNDGSSGNRLLRQVPDILFEHFTQHTPIYKEQDNRDTSNVDMIKLSSSFLVDEQASTIDDECNVVYQDLFKFLCSSKDNIEIIQPSATEYEDFLPSSSYTHVEQEKEEVESSCKMDSEQYGFQEGYLYSPLEDSLRLNFNDVNLNSLSKKDRTFEEESPQNDSIVSLHDDQQWKSSEIDTSITMETDRSIIFSPMSIHDFSMT